MRCAYPGYIKLENFAEQYWEGETPLSLEKQLGHLAGGALPFILVAIITKNPEILAVGVAEGASEEAASDAILAINKSLDEFREKENGVA